MQCYIATILLSNSIENCQNYAKHTILNYKKKIQNKIKCVDKKE